MYFFVKRLPNGATPSLDFSYKATDSYDFGTIGWAKRSRQKQTNKNTKTKQKQINKQKQTKPAVLWRHNDV